MKLTYTTPDRRMTVELEADTQTELFVQLNKFQEVFEDHPRAKFKDKVVDGLDGGSIKYVVRTHDENDYYEKRIVGGPMNGFKKAYGVHKKGGGLFPKRDLQDNCIPGFDGWQLWKKPDNTEQEQQTETKQDKEEGVPF